MCEVGACVVGRWEGGWYRGRVLSVSREEGRVEIQFVDYGNVSLLAKNDLSLVLDKDMEKPEQARRCRFEDTKDMAVWEKSLARQDYKAKLICCGVEGKQVAVVRELEEGLVEGKVTPVVVTHVGQDKVWVTPVKQMELVDKVMSQLGESRGNLKRVNGAMTVGQMAVGVCGGQSDGGEGGGHLLGLW